MIRVYVSGRISAPSDEEIRRNVLLADEVGRELARQGYNPFIPHKQTEGWHALTDFTREQYLALDFDWLALCHVIFMLPGWEDSIGALAEYHQARKLGIPVVQTFEELRRLYPPPGRLEEADLLQSDCLPQVICD